MKYIITISLLIAHITLLAQIKENGHMDIELMSDTTIGLTIKNSGFGSIESLKIYNDVNQFMSFGVTSSTTPFIDKIGLIRTSEQTPLTFFISDKTPIRIDTSGETIFTGDDKLKDRVITVETSLTGNHDLVGIHSTIIPAGENENWGVGGYFKGGWRGVRGITNVGVGVEGAGGTSGTGIFGSAIQGRAIHGRSEHNISIYGESMDSLAIYGKSTTNHGIMGYSDGIGKGGVYGFNDDILGYGVYGYGPKFNGVRGRSDTGDGVYGLSEDGNGIKGKSTSKSGVRGESIDGRGVEGISSTDHGVYGESGVAIGGFGVYGRSYNVGVFGASIGSGIGVKGTSVHNHAVIASAIQNSGNNNYDFYAEGSAMDYGTSSSRRWKSNIQNIKNPLELITQMRGVTYDWDQEHGGGRSDIGFIAEEVGAVLPQIVSYENNGIDAIAMDYTKVPALLVEAFNAHIRQYETKVAQLEKQIEAINLKLSASKNDQETTAQQDHLD